MIWFLIRSLLFLLPAEVAHNIAIFGMQLWSLSKKKKSASAACALKANSGNRSFGKIGWRKKIWGETLYSPLGLAAGLDKDAKCVSALANIGFSFLEVGTVTPKPQDGNPKPRLFRLPHSQAIINRMGFNSEGADVVSKRLAELRGFNGSIHNYPCAIGVNLGKNRDTSLERAEQDYLYGLEKFYNAAHFFVVNLSSPNTPGLRSLLSESYLLPLLKKIQEKRIALAGSGYGRSQVESKHLYLKISPDMTEDEYLRSVEIAMEAGFDGIIACNTSIRRDFKNIDPRDQRWLKEEGGLSGAPIRELSFSHIEKIRKKIGAKPVLISVGGISNVDDIRARLDTGADLVEIYSSFIYQGPSFVEETRKYFSNLILN